MPVTRTFLDWNKAPLQAAQQHICELHSSPGIVDLHHLLLVLPGGRAGRQLQHLFSACATENDLPFLPPTTITVGSLPEQLYTPSLPFADTLTQSLAWETVLRDAPTQDVTLVAPGLQDAPPGQLARCARSLSKLHRELSGAMLTFHDVLENASQMEGFLEEERWRALARFQDSYLALLDANQLWDLQTARLRAVTQGECQFDSPIVLIGVTEVNETIRRMIQAVSDHVTSLVFAPDQMANCFDPIGCLLSSAWESPEVRIPPAQFLVADDPRDEAALAARAVMQRSGEFRREQIVIGMPDPSSSVPLQRQFSDYGVTARPVVDQPISTTPPLRFLEVARNYLARADYKSLAALLRHTDTCTWLEQRNVPNSYLQELDRYYRDHLPRTIETWLGNPDKTEALRSAVTQLDNLLAACTGPPRELSEWRDILTVLLQSVYGDKTLHRDTPSDRRVISALDFLRDTLNRLGQVPSALMPRLSAVDAIELVLREAAETTPTTPFDSEAIELLGWLELPLDTASAVILTSFNEGVIPESVNSDLFLPDALRSHLGLTDNKQRFARDAYALSVLQNSGRDFVAITRRRDANGEPLLPSRLAMLAEGKDLAERVLAFWTDSGTPCGASSHPSSETDFQIPPIPSGITPPEAMSVTSFRDFLRCPYRFYLSHILKLGDTDDRATEMDGAQFGNLLHHILAEFGTCELNNSTSAAAIREYLLQQLEVTADRWFGKNAISSVNVQLGQAARRLQGFAEWQAERTLDGWQIHSVEEPRNAIDGTPPPPVSVTCGTTRMLLSGRIDRIDHHPEQGSWALLDYKTGDSAPDPVKSHFKGGTWVDLQLPLYRHLVRQLGITDEVTLGFIVIPKDPNEIGIRSAQWDADDLRDADHTAATVWDAVQRCEFWPPKRINDDFDPFASICQESVFERSLIP